jgi:phosphoenolpyruvate synthase/pyruvate phosphate dikinase
LSQHRVMSASPRTAAPSIAGQVAPLSSICRADLPDVGAKAANLRELLQAGFPLPDGFVVRSQAFGESGSLISGARGELANALLAIGDGEVTVRSSAVAEDTLDAFFAGHYETVLGMRCEAEFRKIRASIEGLMALNAQKR